MTYTKMYTIVFLWAILGIRSFMNQEVFPCVLLFGNILENYESSIYWLNEFLKDYVSLFRTMDKIEQNTFIFALFCLRASLNGLSNNIQGKFIRIIPISEEYLYLGECIIKMRFINLYLNTMYWKTKCQFYFQKFHI